MILLFHQSFLRPLLCPLPFVSVISYRASFSGHRYPPLRREPNEIAASEK